MEPPWVSMVISLFAMYKEGTVLYHTNKENLEYKEEAEKNLPPCCS